MTFDLSRPGVTAALALLALALGLVPAYAQGTQTGTISGTVNSPDAMHLPGVAVTLRSSAFQGERNATTDASGAFHFRGLPPGVYSLTFALTGFAPFESFVTVALGGNEDVKATLSIASVQETVEVVGRSTSTLSGTQLATNYKYEELVDKLAMNRTLSAIAELAPGLTNNAPDALRGQVTIGGAFAYDNVFLLNGVDINDNLFGTPNNLFIEDALQEISILTSGISAEYGRFSGGVINAVTKSGGNQFQGSFRTDLTNPDWVDESRVEDDAIAAGRGTPHIDDTSFIYSATLGGPVLRDRLWFFGAYRREDSAEARALNVTTTGYTSRLENRRYEGKLTGSITANHKLQVSYIEQTNIQSNNTTSSIDTATLGNRDTPADLVVARYDGVLSSKLHAEAQYSRKTSATRAGGTDTHILESPFLTLGRAGIAGGNLYNAPYFSFFDPDARNNRQYAGALSYFLSKGGTGRHDLRLGGESYTSSWAGSNAQSATGFVFLADPLVAGGQPLKDAAGNIIPNFQPGVTQVQNWRPVRGAQIAIHTLSFYWNDRWRLGERWSFNLGARWEQHTTDTTQAGIPRVKSSAVVPRLGASFDVKGDGKWILQATYGHYAGKASETQFGRNTNVGAPNLVTGLYNGPAGTGVSFAPGFDLANYPTIGGSFPAANWSLEEDLNTPLTKEWTLQAGTRLGSRGELKVVYTNRRTTNVLEDFISIDNGKTTVVEGGRNFGTFDNVVVRNTSDIPRREYQGLVFVANYRANNNWSIGGGWTVQLENGGNFEGERGSAPGSFSIIYDRPEFYTAERHYPAGRVDDYQQNKLRLYTSYDLKLGAGGTLSFSGVYRYNSPLTYSLVANQVTITPQQLARNPGYARPPVTQGLFFAERGSEEFNPSHLFNFALFYDVPVYKTARPFFKVELRNAFNQQPLIGFNTTLTPDPNSPTDALGLRTGYLEGSAFGTPVNNYNVSGSHVPTPREVRFSIGFRF